jgi:hypothetical protein
MLNAQESAEKMPAVLISLERDASQGKNDVCGRKFLILCGVVEILKASTALCVLS